MSGDERTRRAENREIAQLGATVSDLQRLFSQQRDTVNETLVSHSTALECLTENMTESSYHYRGANISLNKFYGEPGDDFAQYIKKFELVCRANNYDSTERAAILGALMDGKAENVYGVLTDAQKADYELLKAALLEKVQTSDYRRYAHEKFQGRKQLTAETVSKYGCDVHKLGPAALAAVDSDQRDALIREKFTAGLLPHLHELIVYSNPNNFHEVMIFAKGLEVLKGNRPDQSARNVMLLGSIHDRLSNMEVSNQHRTNERTEPDVTYVVEAAARNFQVQRPLQRPANMNNFLQQYRPSGILCFQCNRTGHIARNCPRYRNINSVVCRNCNATGHYARNCQRRGQMNRGRGFTGRPNAWNSRSPIRPQNISTGRPINRAMAIDVAEEQTNVELEEFQTWRPLVGSLKVTNNENSEWKLVMPDAKENVSGSEPVSQGVRMGNGWPRILLAALGVA